MAQSDRFYFWRGYYDALKMLPTAEQRDALTMGICAYAFEGEEPDFSHDPILTVVWQVIRDQVAESVAIGREMAERGRKSGEARRKKTGNEQRSNSVPNSVPNEGKGTDRKGSDFPPSGEGSAPDADASARRPGETEDERILRVYGPQPELPPKPDGWA
jgi:hypothetical protein